MAENKFGLHKQVTAIFDGIPIPTQKSSSNAVIEPVDKGFQFNQASTDLVEPKTVTAAPEEFLNFGNSQVYQFDILREKAVKLFSGFKFKTKDRRQTIMLGLSFVLSFVLIFVLFKGPGATKKNHIYKNAIGAKASSIPQINWQKPAEFISTMRDPMQVGSGGGGKSETGEVVVKGIVYSEEDPSVIIDGLILREGEKISGVTILKINSDSVELKKNGKTWSQKVQ